MGMEVGTQQGVRSDINVVPLIDIVLVLLIIFMVVTPMLQRGVPVQLPVGQDPDKKPDTRDDVIVSIKVDETYYITGSEEAAMPEPALKQRLRELFERAPSTPMFVKADKRLRYGTVRQVLIWCNDAGFKNVSLIAEAPQ